MPVTKLYNITLLEYRQCELILAHVDLEVE